VSRHTILLIATCVVAAAVTIPGIGLVVLVAGAASADAFEQITYRDSGGFSGAGTGMSLTVMADGTLQARRRNGPSITRTLREQELTELRAAVAAVEWERINGRYIAPNAADLVNRDLTIVVRGKTYETRADALARIPAALQNLFSRLDALYRQAVSAKEK